MLGFLTTGLVLLLLALIGVIGYALGLVRGRREAARSTPTVGVDDAATYRAGYLAGHLAGWEDARGQSRRPAVRQQQAARQQSATVQQPGTIQTPGRLQQPPAVLPPTPFQPVIMPAAFQQTVGSTAPPRVPPSYSRGPVPEPSFAPTPQQQQFQPTLTPRESPETVAARKEKRDRQNINITLYVASLLLVAAGALFVGTSLPGVFRLVAIWAITILFYASGLIIQRRVPRLRPAAMAFTGTGLALVPVTGLAMYNFALHDGPMAWLITSLLGTAAYVYAALRLDNKVLALLSLSFVVSTAWSGVSVLGGALVWYFTALIGVAILFTLAALVHPRWIPPLYVRPLVVLHPFVVPFVGLAVTMTPSFLAKGEYPMVMVMCALYFAVMLLVRSGQHRLLNFYFARAASTLAVLGFVWDVSSDSSHVLLAGIICLGLQSVGVAFGGKRLVPRTWWYDAVWSLGLQIVASVVLMVMLGMGNFQLPEFLPLFIAISTSMVVGWKLGEGAEFAPAAVLVVAIPFVGLLGAWPVTVLLAVAGLYWFLLGAIRPGPLRHVYVLAGRVALTLAVTVSAAGVFTDHPDRSAYTLFVFVAACAVQQLVSALLEGNGVRTVGGQASTAGFGGAAMAGLLALPLFDAAPGRPTVAVAVGVVVAAGLVSGWFAFPQGRGSSGSGPAGGGVLTWRPTMGEFLAPAAATVAGIVAVVAVSRTLGNVVLLAAVTYFCAIGLRLPASLHRQSYWWLARAAGTLLAASAYYDTTKDAGFRIAGEAVGVGLTVTVVLALQLILPLRAGYVAKFPRPAIIDAGVVLAAMVLCSMFLTMDGVPGGREGWQPGAAATLAALAAVAVSTALRAHKPGWLFAPAAMVLLLALRLENVRDLELLLGIFTAYSGFMVAVTGQRLARGGYLLAVRILSGALVTLVVADFTESAAATSVTVALILILQLPVQFLLQSFLQGRHSDDPFQKAMVWAVPSAQLLLPLVYFLAEDYDGGGRWVLLAELAFVPVTAAIAWRTFGARGAQYFGIAAVTAGVIAAGPALGFPSDTWLYQPLLDKYQVPWVLLALAVAAVVARAVFPPVNAGSVRTGEGSPAAVAERLLSLISALTFTTAGGLLALATSLSLSGFAVLVLASVLFAASHFEGMPSLYAAAAPAALVGAVTAVDGLLDGREPTPWDSFVPWLIGAMGTGAAMYVVRRLGGPSITSQPWRRNALVITSITGLGAAAAAGLARDQTSLVGAGLILVAGVLVVIEVPNGKRLAGEITALATLAGFQRAVLFVDGGSPDWFWAAQWYVVAGAVMAGVRYMGFQRPEGQLRLALTAGLLSLTAVGTSFVGTSSQQIYVLVAHVVLLVAGLLLAERMFVWWGAAGVAASIMWALRSYAFAMLALVALALIVLAVWRLNRKPPATDGNNPTPEPSPASSRDGIR
ncbi:hypothetical protein J2Y41_000450 [Arthrobacter sp. 1088]|uniref:hypothetical protein n=1 Tax=Arthrobacter sp. 1088 TaxID=2817768 RepID=UPI002859A3A5|nr:hypothetical protein [Arthrobacter sp. 1088]MDR6684903.1 hypothetical protein [Arthrobacter sp. 1088]